jgi:hypothetical protein
MQLVVQKIFFFHVVTWQNATSVFAHVATCHASPIGDVGSAWHVTNGATRGPQLARTPISFFFFFPPIFFHLLFSPPIPRQVSPPSQHLPSPLLPHFLLFRLSSLTILQSFSTLPNQQEALFTFVVPHRTAIPLAQLSPVSPAPANTHPPGHRLRRAPPSSPQSHSPLRAGISPSPVCYPKIVYLE